MKIAFSLTAVLSLAALLGCDTTPTPSKPVTNTPRTTLPADNRATDPPAPNNTGVNERDRDPAAKTPIDQNENQADIDITAKIRQGVLAEENMSVDARNSKIITADGKVTLRGPVSSTGEKDTIDRIAREVAGKDNVDNQLEVKPE